MELQEGDAFIADMQKEVDFNSAWSMDGSYHKKKRRFLVKQNGVHNGHYLTVVYDTRWTPPTYTLSLDFDNIPLVKVVNDPYSSHLNSAEKMPPGVDMGIIKGEHYFDWEDNKRLLLVDAGKNYPQFARPAINAFGDFPSTVRWMMQTYNMRLDQGSKLPKKPNS